MVKAPTLLCYLRRIPHPSEVLVQKIGIDDFALKRGACYGTIRVNLETGKPLDLLPDRTSDAVFPWLVRHQEIEVVSRARANGYMPSNGRCLIRPRSLTDFTCVRTCGSICNPCWIVGIPACHVSKIPRSKD